MFRSGKIRQQHSDKNVPSLSITTYITTPPTQGTTTNPTTGRESKVEREKDTVTGGYFLKPSIGSFNELNTSDEILTGITSMGYETPSNVQRHGIVPLMKNEKDALIQAPAGQGKTACFGIACLHLCMEQLKNGYHFDNGPVIIIVEPTKDLAEQTATVLNQLGHFTGIKTITCVGGEPIWKNGNALNGTTGNTDWSRNGNNCNNERNADNISMKHPGIVVVMGWSTLMLG